MKRFALIIAVMFAPPCFAADVQIDELPTDQTLGWVGLSQLSSTGDGNVTMRANNGTTGVGLNLGTDGTLTVGTLTLTTDLSVAQGGTGASDAAGARTSLGLVIGTNVQAFDADLTTWASVTPSANGQSLVSAANYAAMRTALSLAPGTDVLAFDAGLQQIADLADPNADRIVFWDDSAGAYTFLTVGSGLSITGTTITASGGGGGAPDDATYITQTANSTLSAEQALGSLSTGILKNTTTTGVLSIAVADTDYIAPAAIGVTVQGYDADLATWAGVTSSSNGRSLVSAADYSAMRTLLSLVAGTNVQAFDADLSTWAGVTPSANGQSLVAAADYSAMRTLLSLVPGTNVQAFDADLSTLAGVTPGATGLALLDDATASAARDTLGATSGVFPVAAGGTGVGTLTGLVKGNGTSAFTAAVSGTDFVAPDAELTAIAGLTSAANKGIQFTGSGTAATYDLTTAGKNLLDDSDTAAQRATLGVSVRTISIILLPPTTAAATGDGKAYFVVPASMNGGVITAVTLTAVTAGTTGTTDVQIANVTNANDVLSTKVTLDSTEPSSSTAATPAVINASNDDLATNNVLRIDVDAVSTTPPQGLIVTIEVTK